MIGIGAWRMIVGEERGCGAGGCAPAQSNKTTLRVDSSRGRRCLLQPSQHSEFSFTAGQLLLPFSLRWWRSASRRNRIDLRRAAAECFPPARGAIAGAPGATPAASRRHHRHHAAAGARGGGGGGAAFADGGAAALADRPAAWARAALTCVASGSSKSLHSRGACRRATVTGTAPASSALSRRPAAR